MKKEEFLKLLTSLSKEELSKLIMEKGKEPKKIKPYILFLK